LRAWKRSRRSTTLFSDRTCAGVSARGSSGANASVLTPLVGAPPGSASGARTATQPQNPDSDARWLLTVDGPSPEETSMSRQPTTSRRTTLANRS